MFSTPTTITRYGKISLCKSRNGKCHECIIFKKKSIVAATAWKLNQSKGIKSKWLRYFYVWQRFNVITGASLWFAVMMQWWSKKVILFESVHASYLLSRVVTRPKNEHSPEAMMREAITQITALNAKPHLLFTISIFPVIKHNLGFKKFLRVLEKTDNLWAVQFHIEMHIWCTQVSYFLVVPEFHYNNGCEIFHKLLLKGAVSFFQ